MDSALVQDCVGTDTTAADWLLALEVIFRRAFEQAAQSMNNCEEAK